VIGPVRGGERHDGRASPLLAAEEGQLLRELAVVQLASD
jgi:hypothetical protein